jgi:hypothetical protein
MTAVQAEQAVNANLPGLNAISLAASNSTHDCDEMTMQQPGVAAIAPHIFVLATPQVTKLLRHPASS